jgi:phosphoenolpyruvate-protein phosphotransferase (PTS system enzyme I)
MKSYQGIGASDGLVIATAQVWRKTRAKVVGPARSTISPEEELERLDVALADTRDDLLILREELRQKLGQDHATILDAQILILEDEEFLGEVRRLLREERIPAESAFARAMAQALLPLDLSGDGLFRERIVDFRDVEQRVLRTLHGTDDSVPHLAGPRVLVARDLTPSETAALDVDKILGFCLEEGSANSHTVIIARSLGVPAVVSAAGVLAGISDGLDIAMDGGAGRFHVEPDSETNRRFEARIRRRREVAERLAGLRDEPAETPDGRRVELAANVELPIEIDLALSKGAEGIGLVRTEYFYFRSERLPGEEEQLRSYREVLERAEGRTVIFRVLDVGGDKVLTALGGMREYNPFLGWRGVRFLLSNPEILRTQLRAIYRASAFGSLRIMFPMITGVEELRAVQAECIYCRETLREEGHAFAEDIEIGIMVETPAAAAVASDLAKECDFFSIGSNDLTQYVLAVDRTNERVSYLYQPHHPAVLRTIRATIDAAKAAGIWVGLCGEMGSNPALAILLVGLGIDEISTNAAAIPLLKKVIRSIEYGQARKWAEEALALSTAGEVDRYLRARVQSSMREFLNEETIERREKS